MVCILFLLCKARLKWRFFQLAYLSTSDSTCIGCRVVGKLYLHGEFLQLLVYF